MKMEVCKWCGNEYENRNRRDRCCTKCETKTPLLPSFVRARDELRVKLGLKPMGSQYDNRWWL
jgi:hypothetical protein